MNGLTEILLRFFDLLEAEGRLLQRTALLTVRMAVLLALGLIFGAAALAFLVAALYQALIVVLHPAWALCLLALVCAGIAGVLLWLSLPRKKSLSQQTSEPGQTMPQAQASTETAAPAETTVAGQNAKP